MSDSDEALAGTDPADATSVLKIATVTPEGAWLSHHLVECPGKELRSPNSPDTPLNASFAALPDAQNIPASADTTTTFLDTAAHGTGTGYYRITLVQ